ncbi:MAG: acetyl-CoA C-acetyltransferase, partial [Calditrichales bacterium]
MATTRSAVIVGAARTPIGSFFGSLSSLPATKLGSLAIEAAIERAGIDKTIVNEVIMGNVLSAGEGQAPARQAALGAGLPVSTECMTINKVCGSGLKSIMLASQAIRAGDADIVVAGGMESMSNVPYYLLNARQGLKMGHQRLVDGMIHDGLWDVYNDYHMGSAAELCAETCHISRERQDEFSILSYQRAIDAQKQGKFKDEIVPVLIPQKKGDPLVIDSDEEPAKVRFDKIPTLRPVFKKDGTVTAANASSINDGAAAIVLTSEEMAKDHGLNIIATIREQATAAKEPQWFTTAPVDSIKKCLNKAGLKMDDIDLFEINEAFAVVSLVVTDQLGIDLGKVNVNGGAVALGHPIGASGTRILVTLLYEMIRQKAKRGIASLC